MSTRSINQIFDDLSRTASTVDFVEKTLVALDELVPSQSVVFNEVSITEGVTRAVSHPHELLGQWERLLPVWERFFDQSPMIQFAAEDPDPGVVRWSDGDIEAFYRTELYQQFFAVLGIRHQMAFSVPGPVDFVRGFALNRADEPFTDAERQLVSELRPHLALLFRAAAFRNQAVVDGLSGSSGRTVVVVDSIARVIDPVASERFGLGDDGQLWPEIREWIRGQIVPERNMASPDSPIDTMVVGSEPTEPAAAVRLVPDVTGLHLVIVWPGTRQLISPAAIDGLTKRQAAVVQELLLGGTNADIAARLGISVETVKKHLTAAYHTLGVSDRASAMAAAREETTE